MLTVSSKGINICMKITSLWEFISARYHLTAFIGTNKMVVCLYTCLTPDGFPAKLCGNTRLVFRPFGVFDYQRV